jgi:hypothetical protein
MLEENKTQTPEPETKAENQPVETASPELEIKTEMPTEVIPETEEKIETKPEIEIQTKQEIPTQPIAQENTPPIIEAPKEPQNQPEPTPQPQPKPQIKTVEKIIYKTDPNIIQKLLNKARAKIQERKHKKLDKIMTLFETKSQITNEDVQKLLRTTKRTATRYFDLLEQEQKITQIGKTGKAVFYTKK